jgi:hypothetical protein
MRKTAVVIEYRSPSTVLDTRKMCASMLFWNRSAPDEPTIIKYSLERKAGVAATDPSTLPLGRSITPSEKKAH